ncbi:unnamed protein product [Withania somnifera]
MKWLWRYNEDGQGLWKEVIKSKYGEFNPLCSNISSNPYEIGVWRTIRSLWPKLEKNLVIKVGDGRRTKYCGDVWNNQIPLKGWNLSFRRLLNDWEVDRVANVLHGLEYFEGTTTDPDILR